MSTGTKVEIKLSAVGQSQVLAAFNQIQSGAASLGAAIKNMAVPLAGIAGAAVGLTSVAAGFKSIVEQGGKLADLSARTSVGVKALIRWREVFEESGKSADDIGGTFDKVSRSIYTAATAGGPAQLAFAKIGVTAKELSALAPEDQFERLAKAINSIPNPAERSAIAMQIFGKGAGDLLPVFETMRDMAGVDGALGRLPEVLGRNIKILDDIGDSFTQLKLKGDQFFAGVMDQVGGPLRDLLSDVTKIDLTKAGQNVGAFVNVAVDAWKEGKFGEFVSLSIEAAFEQAGAWARASFRSLAQAFGGGDFWAPVGVGLLTAINEGLKSIASGITYLAVPFAAVGDYIRDAFTYAFLSAANSFGVAIRNTVNATVNFLNEKFGTEFRSLTYTARATTAPNFSSSMERAAVGRSGALDAINSFFDSSTAAARSLAGTGGTGGTGSFDATNKLSALISDMEWNREKSALLESSIFKSVAAQLPIVSVMAGLRDKESESLRLLRTIEDERSRIMGSFSLTQAEKYKENLRLLTSSREELERMVALLREQAALPGLSDQERTQISQRADSFDTRLSGVNKQLGAIGPDPNSTPQQMMAALTELQNQFGTVAQGIARSFKTVIGTAVESVSHGLQKLIGDTEYWTKRLGNIAGPIMGAVTASISRMFTEWIVQRGLAAAKNIFFSTQEGSADAAAKAPGALMSSISSWGIAAGVGLAAFLAATALTGGFQSGGYTGDGRPDQVAGVVHRGEFVVDAMTVDRVGLPALQALQVGGSPAAAPVQAGPSGSVINIAMMDTPSKIRHFFESEEGENLYVDMARKNYHRIERR